MQNMQRYFGFRVRVSDFLEPEDYAVVRDRVDLILSREPKLDTQYRVYLHQLVLEEVRQSQFGMGGGLSARVEKVHLRFSINPKQRQTGDIKFMNYRFEKELHEEVAHYYMADHILYSLSPRYFEERGYFQNTLITLVRVGLREHHKKIKIRVSVDPTQSLVERLVRTGQAAAETNIDLDFRKARVFNRQTKLFTSRQEATMASEANGENRVPSARTIINVDRVGTLISDSSGPISGFSNDFNENQVLVDHLLQELRQLSRSLRDDPPSGVPKEEVGIVDAVINEAPKDKSALKSLATAGKWLVTRSEKVGLALLTEYLKSQAGL